MKVYRSTATRGRVLMVNVRNPSDREGSQHDYQNLENMFGKFGFIVSKLSGSKPWTGQVRAQFVKPILYE